MKIKKTSTIITSKVVTYIQEQQEKVRQHYIHRSIPLMVKDFPSSEDVNIKAIIKFLEENIPPHLMRSVDAVYIGEFPELEDRNAVFADGAIYCRNDEATNYDFLENIVHEIAHSLIDRLWLSDEASERVKKEFLGKRERLRMILNSEGYKLPKKYYVNMEYSPAFDEFLSQTVGYPRLLNLTMGLFVSPYGATSLEEYFANAFENFYLEDPDDVKKISPALYDLIVQLHQEEEN